MSLPQWWWWPVVVVVCLLLLLFGTILRSSLALVFSNNNNRQTTTTLRRESPNCSPLSRGYLMKRQQTSPASARCLSRAEEAQELRQQERKIVAPWTFLSGGRARCADRVSQSHSEIKTISK